MAALRTPLRWAPKLVPALGVPTGRGQCIEVGRRSTAIRMGRERARKPANRGNWHAVRVHRCPIFRLWFLGTYGGSRDFVTRFNVMSESGRTCAQQRA